MQIFYSGQAHEHQSMFTEQLIGFTKAIPLMVGIRPCAVDLMMNSLYSTNTPRQTYMSYKYKDLNKRV